MTVVADTSEIFPACPTFGFTAEPNYLVKITKREGGFERRQRVWDKPLTNYSAVPLGDQIQAEIENVLYFWHAVGGMSNCFRFKDWIDYKSCRLDADPSATDQPLEPSGDSGAVSYRLLKQYVYGSMIQQRYVQRPVGDTIVVSNQDGNPQAASTFSIDEATGLLTPNEDFVGTPSLWGGEFYVWVRFDAQFNPSYSDHQILNATIQLAEIRQALA